MLNHPTPQQTTTSSKISAVLEQAIVIALDTLKMASAQGNFLDQLQIAFGSDFDRGIAAAIQSDLQSGNVRLLPPIAVRTATELPGANGAYDSTNDRILISVDFLTNNMTNPSAVVNLLLEEIGHKFDRILNGAIDSPGDEGAIFAAIVQVQFLSVQALTQLRAEDDHRTFSLDGQQVAVELETWIGTAGDDVYTGTSDDDFVAGLAGNDRLDGDEGNDLIYGGLGNDSLFGSDSDNAFAGGNDILFGNEGNDFLSGGPNDDNGQPEADILIGGSGDDFLNGAFGNDYLDGEDGFDVLSGGAGDDVLYGGNGNDTLDGDEGNDYLNGGADPDDLYGGEGNDYLVGEGASDYLYGEAGDDVIYGGSGFRDYLYGGLGNDYLNGETGNDTIAGDEGDDYLEGQAGDDSLLGGLGNDALFGGDGFDSLLGGAGNDALLGGTGNDTLLGGDGDDYLLAGADFNTLTGGNGADIFVYDTYSGQVDTITDFNVNQDVLDLRGLFSSLGVAATPDYLKLVQSGADTLVQIDTNGTTNGANFTTLVTLTSMNNTSYLIQGSNFLV
jgi:Ca2+-binding RTX toxin-like protein